MFKKKKRMTVVMKMKGHLAWVPLGFGSSLGFSTTQPCGHGLFGT